MPRSCISCRCNAGTCKLQHKAGTCKLQQPTSYQPEPGTDPATQPKPKRVRQGQIKAGILKPSGRISQGTAL